MPIIHNHTRLPNVILPASQIRCARHNRLACRDKACLDRIAERLGEKAAQIGSALYLNKFIRG